MKLTKKEALNIVEDYNLGEMKSFAPLGEGWVNHNYEINTDKGEFVVRILGKKWDAKKKRGIRLEFAVLQHLHKVDFPYKTPLPIKNKRGKFLEKIKWSYFWVYKKLPGKHNNKFGKKEIGEIAKALALYHKAVKNVKGVKKFEINFSKIKKSFEEMGNVKPKNKLDRFILKNIDFFKEMLKRSTKIKFDANVLPAHSDFHKTNLLWSKGKIIGIIDFDNLVLAPKIRDLAQVTKSCLFNKDKLRKSDFELFVKEYSKINSLTKKEKEMILPFLIKYNCRYWDLFYNLEGKKNLMKNKFYLERWINGTTRGAAKEIGWIK